MIQANLTVNDQLFWGLPTAALGLEYRMETPKVRVCQLGPANWGLGLLVKNVDCMPPRALGLIVKKGDSDSREYAIWGLPIGALGL